MSNYDEQLARSGRGDAALALDAGRRRYMLGIYNNMVAGVGLTAIVAWLTYQFTGPALLQNPLMWVFILAPLVLVFFISARIHTLSVTTARWLFFIYAALVGVSLSTSFTSIRIPRLHACSSSRPRCSARSVSLATPRGATFPEWAPSCSWG